MATVFISEDRDTLSILLYKSSKIFYKRHIKCPLVSIYLGYKHCGSCRALKKVKETLSYALCFSTTSLLLYRSQRVYITVYRHARHFIFLKCKRNMRMRQDQIFEESMCAQYPSSMPQPTPFTYLTKRFQNQFWILQTDTSYLGMLHEYFLLKVSDYCIVVSLHNC